jgi:glycosyltransferase involved in cell wall biosynthesis
VEVSDVLEVNIVHPSLNKLGGAERVCLEMIGVLRDSGYRVNLFTIDEVDWEDLRRGFGEAWRPDAEHHLFPRLPGGSVLGWLLLSVSYIHLLLRAKRIKGSVTINNYGEVFPFIADLSYVHSIPLHTSAVRRQNPFRVPLWRVTSRIYLLSYRLLRRLFRMSAVVANSRYVSKLVDDGSKALFVLHPPVRVRGLLGRAKPKERIIFTLSRIKGMKRLSIIPEIAAGVGSEGCRFLLMGKMDEGACEVVHELAARARRLGVEAMIEVVGNPDRRTVEEGYSVSRIYLSTQPTETFGMAVVEAMSHGCVPLVPSSGGPWIDILDGTEGRYGFSYDSPAQAARNIAQLFSDTSDADRTSERAIKRASRFGSEVFRRRFLRLMQACERAASSESGPEESTRESSTAVMASRWHGGRNRPSRSTLQGI